MIVIQLLIGGYNLNRKKTLVIGIGEVGGALADVLSVNEPVLRHDLEIQAFDDSIGVMHICIPCRNGAEFEAAVLAYIDRFQPELTVINSTVIPGTTRRIAQASGAAVAYSPVRGKHARMASDLRRYFKFVAAAAADIAAAAERHFQRHGMKTRRMNLIETLELAKLAETTYFGVLIAFAQVLNRYCDQINGDYYEATQLFEEIDFLPRCRYFPGIIGGHCVLPNLQLLLQLEPSALLHAVLESNACRIDELSEPHIAQETVKAGVDR